MAKHTSEPLVLESLYDRELGWCYLPNWQPVTTLEDVEELRILLEAAPEMLEALEDARRLIEDLPIDAMGEGETTITGPDGEASLMRWPIRDELLDKVNAAIAKARRTL